MSAVPRGGDSDRFARALLSCACEPGSAAVGALVADVGAKRAIEQIRQTNTSSRISTLSPTRVERAFEQADHVGARFVIPGDAEWPTQLDDLGDETPFGLWVLGASNLRLLALRSLALVGARAATQYGVRTASVLASDVAQRGWCVVSGGAYGIDAAAHRGALAVGASTIVVLASGVDHPYPATHAALFEQCRTSGLLISEAPPAEPARRWRFLARNRVIAALTRGTVVVEAAHRSGALNTARCAADLGREVFGVPGLISSTASAGVHALIRSGATLVSSADDVISAVKGDESATQFDVAGAISRLGVESGATFQTVVAAGSASVADLANRLGVSQPDITADLAGLELAGLVERHTGGWAPTAPVSEHLQSHDTVQMLDFT